MKTGRLIFLQAEEWTNMATSQGMPTIAGSLQNLGERHGIDSPIEPPKGINTALILDLQPAEL